MLVRALAPLTAFALAASPLYATDLHVGPSAAFSQIQPAIDAAAPGDTIHVAPGQYDVFVLDKPLSILGAGSGSVLVRDPDGVLGCSLSGMPAGTQTVLSGFEIGGPGVPGSHFTNPARLAVTNCEGRVTLHDLRSAMVAPNSYSMFIVSLYFCEQVIVSRCQFLGTSASPGGQMPLSAIQSKVWLVGSELRAGDNPVGTIEENPFGSFPASRGSPALQLLASRAHVARSIVVGGRGGVRAIGGLGAWIPEAGGPGVSMTNSACTISGGTGNLLRGGDAPPAKPWYSQVSSGGAAFDAGPFPLPSVLVAAEDATLEGGLNQLGVQASAVGSTLVVFVPESFARPTLLADQVQPAVGTSTTLEFSGPPSGVQLAYAAFSAADALTLPFGELLLPLSALQLSAAALDSAGLANKQLAIPANPALAGAPVWLQSVSLAGGQLALSNPAFFVIGI